MRRNREFIFYKFKFRPFWYQISNLKYSVKDFFQGTIHLPMSASSTALTKKLCAQVGVLTTQLALTNVESQQPLANFIVPAPKVVKKLALKITSKVSEL